MSETTAVKPAAKKSNKLSQAQLAHALNRLQSIHQTKTNCLRNAGQVGLTIDWTNEKAVDAFVKESDLPKMTWVAWGQHMYAPTPASQDLFTKVNKALQTRQKKRQGSVTELAQQANALLAKAQDDMIFSRLTPEEVPLRFAAFEKQLDELLAI